jgi:Alr-MurF fusion protein
MNVIYKVFWGIVLQAAVAFSSEYATIPEVRHQQAMIYENSLTANRYGILGAGPTGLYLSYKILSQNQNAQVEIFESRKPTRPQVVRIPYEAADSLSVELKSALWPDLKVKEAIFGVKEEGGLTNPLPYKFWPFIQIKDFQEKLLSYLTKNFKSRFKYVEINENEITPENISLNQNYRAMFITTGGGKFQKDLREILNKKSLATAEPQPKLNEMGVYLIYQNTGVEDYSRQGKLMNPKTLADRGLTYAAANNSSFDVQLYTYPTGSLKEIYSKMPESFKNKANFKGNLTLSANQEELNGEEKEWLEAFRKQILQDALDIGVKLPQKVHNQSTIDFDKIKIYYAPRYEYAYKDVAFNNLKGIPMLFVGDSAGSTDYRFGLSLGRGLLAADHIVSSLKQSSGAIHEVATNYQAYWEKDVLPIEFNQKNPALTSIPSIQYKYILKGRIVGPKKL